MNVDHLHSDELEYELMVRGYPTDGTVAEKRKRLRPALRMEREGITFSKSVNLAGDEELRICAEKVGELEAAVDNFNYNNASNEYKRYRSRLLHVMGRLNRIQEQEGDSQKGRIMMKCGEISDFLEESVLLLDPVNIPEFPTCIPNEIGRSPQNTHTTTVSNIASPRLDASQGYVSPGRNTSLIDVDPQNLATAITDLQINRAVSTVVTSGTQTSTTATAPIGGTRNTQAPTELFSYPVGVAPTTGPTREALPLSMPNIAPATLHFSGAASQTLPSCQFQPNIYYRTMQSVAPHLEPMGSNPSANTSHPSRRVSFPSLPGNPDREIGFNNRSGGNHDDRLKIFKSVSQWNLKFDGSNSINNFLAGVEELRVACGITKLQLRGAAVVLFTGVALDWFRANVQPSHTWDALVEMLRISFLPGEYDEDVWSDIRSRTQGLHERATTFVAVMQNLFHKLSEVPGEQTRLRIIRRNLLPYIQSQLALTDYETIAELTVACQRVEDAQARIARFKPPPTNPALVMERELMYNPRQHRHQVTTIDAPRSTDPSPTPLQGNSNQASSSNQPVTRGVQTLTCWNCRQRGHLRRDCRQPRARYCFGCGHPDVTRATCPRCQGNGPVAR